MEDIEDPCMFTGKDEDPCRCDETDCHECYPTLFTGWYEEGKEEGLCKGCGNEEGDHAEGGYCYPTRGLCPCGSGLAATKCCKE